MGGDGRGCTVRTGRQCLFSARKTAKNDPNSLPRYSRYLSRTNERGNVFGLAAAFLADLSYIVLPWDSEAATLLAALLTSALGKAIAWAKSGLSSFRGKVSFDIAILC
jgi:hypothetical protein